MGDRRGDASASFNLAGALDSLGQRDDAIRHAARARVIFEAIESPHAEMVRRKFAAWRGEA